MDVSCAELTHKVPVLSQSEGAVQIRDMEAKQMHLQNQILGLSQFLLQVEARLWAAAARGSGVGRWRGNTIRGPVRACGAGMGPCCGAFGVVCDTRGGGGGGFGRCEMRNGEMWHGKIVAHFAVVFQDRSHVLALTRSVHIFSPLQGSEGLNCWGYHVFILNPVSPESSRESR